MTKKHYDAHARTNILIIGMASSSAMDKFKKRFCDAVKRYDKNWNTFSQFIRVPNNATSINDLETLKLFGSQHTYDFTMIFNFTDQNPDEFLWILEEFCVWLATSPNAQLGVRNHIFYYSAREGLEPRLANISLGGYSHLHLRRVKDVGSIVDYTLKKVYPETLPNLQDAEHELVGAAAD